MQSAGDNDKNPTAVDNDKSPPTKTEKKVAGRKPRVDAGHRIVASSYSLITCIALVKYQATLRVSEYNQ